MAVENYVWKERGFQSPIYQLKDPKSATLSNSVNYHDVPLEELGLKVTTPAEVADEIAHRIFGEKIVLAF